MTCDIYILCFDYLDVRFFDSPSCMVTILVQKLSQLCLVYRKWTSALILVGNQFQPISLVVVSDLGESNVFSQSNRGNSSVADLDFWIRGVQL